MAYLKTLKPCLPLAVELSRCLWKNGSLVTFAPGHNYIYAQPTIPVRAYSSRLAALLNQSIHTRAIDGRIWEHNVMGSSPLASTTHAPGVQQ
jgi:hypothetical protein